MVVSIILDDPVYSCDINIQFQLKVNRLKPIKNPKIVEIWSLHQLIYNEVSQYMFYF